MIRSIKYIGLVLVALVFVACSKHNTEGGVKLPKKKDTELMDSLDVLAGQEYDYFYSKISTKYKDSAQSVSFKVSSRVIADTTTNLLITYARIPFVNSLITEDSVTVTNKKDKCYIEESIGFIKEKFSVDFTLKNVEEMLLGLPLGYDPELKYYQMESTSEGYVMCSHTKRELKKIDKGEIEDIVMFYTLSPDLTQLVSTVIVSPKDRTEIKINYKTRELIDTYLLPKTVEIRILTPEQEIEIDMEYKKTRINEVESIHFVIPESYGKCE